MSWETFDYVLLRGLLPVMLLGSTITRYNGFSFVYLIMLLICPLLRFSITENTRKSVYIYLIILITLTGMFSLSIPIFHIPIQINNDLLLNCSNSLTSVSHQIGIMNLNGVPFHRVLRLVLPDYLVLIVAVSLLIYYCKRQVPLNFFEVDHSHSADENFNNDYAKNSRESEVNTPESMVAGSSKVLNVSNVQASTSFITLNQPHDFNPDHHTSRRPHESHNYLHETFGIDRLRKKFWRAWAMQSLFVFFNVIVTGFAGIVSPSILNAVYLFGFLGVCTFWALGNKVITTNFAYMRIFLLMYSAIHLCLIYLVQIESVQGILPNGQFSSRLLGLYYLVDTSCIKRGEFIFQNQRWIDYLSPCTIFYVYYLCGTETRRWFEKGRESVPRVRSYKEDTKLTSIKQLNTHDPELQHLITDKEIVSRAGSTLTTTTSKVQDYQATNQTVPIVNIRMYNVTQKGEQIEEDIESFQAGIVTNQGDNVKNPAIIALNHTERPLLLSVINTSIRNSFVFTFIAMMAWSVTYKSWMSFILLLSACILWMMPDSRRACLYMSPLIVFYATCLIIIQYIYGFNLVELPEFTFTSSGSKIDLAEIGLHKWGNPTGPLAVMIGFLVIFWLTLRLFMNERFSHSQKSPRPKESPEFDHESNTDSEAYFGNVDNAIYRKIISFVNGICEKYWILVCCFAMLFVSVQGPVVVFRIVYMFMLMYFLLTFMCSYSFWRKQMYTFWWFVIVYSVIVLLCIYTFQFKQFPYLWKNKTGLSEEILRDIGLQTYNSAALFQGLLTPVVFLVVIIVQVRYFHRPFLRLSSMSRFQYMDNRQSGNNQTNLKTSVSTTSTSNVSAFIEDVNSAFQMVVEKVKEFFEIIYTKVWRFFECHFTKIVVFSIMHGCINEVNASNIILILIIVVGFPFPKLQSMLVTFSFLWCSLIVLMKMIYQLKSVQKFNWVTNCSAYNNDFNRSMDNIDNAQWIGLTKVPDFEDHIWQWTAVLVACSLWQAVKYHQIQYYNCPDSELPPKGIVFPEISAKSIDDSLINLIKFAFNFTFYKLGLELCHIVTVIVACLRVDVYSVVYLTLLLIFLCTPRRVCSRLWLPYMLFLGALLPIQYVFCVGFPPGLCLKYPIKLSVNLQQWLFLPSYSGPPVAKKLMADFFQFIFVALQYQVFKIENSPGVENYGGGKNRPILSNELPKTIDKDFVSTKDSYVDYLKHAVFYWSYWLSLAIVFTTGVFWITLFCLGYMILAFIYLWMGQNIMLRKRSNLIASWNVIIYYNFFVILSKCSLQLMGCVYLKVMMEQHLCWIILLFGVQCINPMSWNILNNIVKNDSTCSSVDSGLHWDVICFLFIILQRKIFMTKSFCHVVLDLNVQNRFASRGAYLINKKMMATIREQKLKEERVLTKIQQKIDKIIQRQAQHGKPELNEHYLVVRSGDYYLFEGDPEEDDDCVQNFNDDHIPTKKALVSLDEVNLMNGQNFLNKSVSEYNSEETVTNDPTNCISKNPTLLSKFGLNTIKEVSSVTLDKSRKGSDVAKKGQTEKKDAEKTKDQEFSESSDEDDANPAQTQNALLNPLQLINRAMEQGPRSAVREFKRTQSESRENITSNRRCSVHMGSRLESMSEQDELNSLPDAYNTPPRMASGSATEDSFYSTSVQHDNIGNFEQYQNTNEDIINYATNPDIECTSPSIYKDANSSEELLNDEMDKRGTDKSTHPESCWSKFKASILVFYYFIQSTTDSVIILINGWTREYRRISRNLENEKRLVKCKVISKISNENDSRIQLEEIVQEIVGNRTATVGPLKNQEECLKEQEFRRSRSRFFLLAIAVGNFAIIYSEFVCYFLLILNHMLSGNLFSLPYPLMVFLWAMLSVPRPSKNFWIALITYTEIIIVIKYIFQFQFIQFNIITNTYDSLWIPRIVGIEKSKNYAVLDLIQLLFIFLHRGYLKNTGCWRDHVEFAQDLEIVDKEQSERDRVQPSFYESNIVLSRWSCNPINKMRRFYAKMTNPKFNKKVDVYVYMFLCEFIAFLIIIFGYVSFGPGTDSADNAFDFIKTNKIPVPFIVMIITQFVFIIIDRALFLRKQVKGKFIFQVFHVILIHAWLFFILPRITRKTFNSQVAPQLLYFVKCIYFALSAYQMKSGYPLRILGNFLTRNFNYVNLFLFKGYMIVPFLYELRNVMDWMWTDTAVALYHWMEVEDVFCKIFVLKCWRRSELEYPTLRGHTRRLASKYSVGGLLLTFFFFCFWGPLTLSSFIVTTFNQNPPLDCDITISVGGFSSLYVFNTRKDHLKQIKQETFDKIKLCYSNDMPSTSYLQSFEVGDVTELCIDQVSGNYWAINPPGLDNLKKRLDSTKDLYMNMKTVCERKLMDAKSTEKFVSYTHSKKLSYEEKLNILKVIRNEVPSFNLSGVFPRYLTAFKRNLGAAKVLLNKVIHMNFTYINLQFTLKHDTYSKWWELKENGFENTFCPNETSTKVQLNSTKIFMFSERVSDNLFGHLFSNYGILGMYAAYIFVAHRVLRAFYSDISYIIRLEELPHVDRILNLLNEIYLVRENKMFRLEEQLIAKLIFLYRSSETIIKWTRHKKSILEKHMEKPIVNNSQNLIINNDQIDVRNLSITRNEQNQI